MYKFGKTKMALKTLYMTIFKQVECIDAICFIQVLY